jgi:Cu/Ag efflux protein CusF
MKTRLFSTFAAAVALVCSGISTVQAQEPVSTGIIHGLVEKAGVLTLRSDQNQRLLTFHGMDQANVFTADGQPAKMADMKVGDRVTVQYATRNGKWYISKVILPAPTAAPAAGLPVNVDPAVRSRAANDRDITTQPGSRARIDNDITTQPTNNAAFDRDITTQPPKNAAFDNDITTRPGND